jgi:hypothetical protein
MDPRPPLEDADAAREVEDDLEELGDADASPATPAGTLAVAAGSRAKRGVVAGSSEEIWRLAWPVMLSLTLASIVGIADIAMVGRLGASAQAAVGYAAQLFFVAQSALFALSFACVALMARAIGAGRELAQAGVEQRRGPVRVQDVDPAFDGGTAQLERGKIIDSPATLAGQYEDIEAVVEEPFSDSPA